MLPSRQYFRALLNETERDAKFTRSDFRNKLPVLYFIHYNSLLIYCDVAGKMDFGYERVGNALHLQTGFVNKWWRLFYRTSTFIEVQIPK